MIHRRAVVAYWRALGSTRPCPADAHLNMCTIHNSLISREQGKPWPEIDYSAMREARRLCDAQNGPSRVISRLYDRKIREFRLDHGGR